MTKIFKNAKRVLAFVFAFAVLAVSLFTGSINIDADACDANKVVYWNGTKASSFAGGTGSESDPYIIKTAEQLALACLGQNPTTSTGKYYKVDDSVKVFVMQPESVVDFDTLSALNSAEAVKTYLTGLSGVKNWMSEFASASFNGNFDGNYATIYGLYADGVAVGKSDVGLFPQYDGGSKDTSGNVIANTCKNISVKNSYFNSSRRVGAIVGASYGTGYGAKIDGIIYYDTISVVNCYLTAVGNTAFFQEQGVLSGGGMNDTAVINNVLLRGNYGKNTDLGYNMGIIAATSKEEAGVKDSTGTTVKSKVSNSIILGTDPYCRDYYINHIFQMKNYFDNVITDYTVGKVTINNPWGTQSSVEYKEEQIKQVTAVGFDFQEATKEKFDWENDWFMGENGAEMRAFHGEIKLVQTATTHCYKCQDCGLKSYGGEAQHSWTTTDNKAYSCSVCQYNCKHDSIETTTEDGDCVSVPGTYTRCNHCPYVGIIPSGAAPGHNLTYVAADPGDCENHGHGEYWYCDVCNKKFASNDKMAAMDTALTDTELDTGLGNHIKDTNDNGTIVMYDESGHWYICKVDGGRLDYDSNAIGDDEVIAHEYKDGECVYCGYVCLNHEWKSTGKVAVAGTCTTDEELEIKCKICGKKDTVVSEKAGHKITFVAQVDATDRMEGTKAHYECSACKGIFSDAEGKNSITKTSLIIPKVLPAEYQNTINSDKGNKSPATGDSFASVIAVAALGGATLLLTRKVRK